MPDSTTGAPGAIAASLLRRSTFPCQPNQIRTKVESHIRMSPLHITFHHFLFIYLFFYKYFSSFFSLAICCSSFCKSFQSNFEKKLEDVLNFWGLKPPYILALGQRPIRPGEEAKIYLIS